MHVKKIISIIITSILSLIVAGLLIILIKNTIALKNNQISSFFGYSISYVPTESMEPTINPGETVLIKKGSIKDANIGDIIPPCGVPLYVLWYFQSSRYPDFKNLYNSCINRASFIFFDITDTKV